MHPLRILTVAAVALLATMPRTPRAQERGAVDAAALRPTAHSRVPDDLGQLWLAPEKGAARTAVMNDLAHAVRLEVDSNFAAALPILSRADVQEGTLGPYATYYRGLAELRLGRPSEAKRTFEALRKSDPVGYLAEGTSLREAESHEALGEWRAAADIYDRLSKTKTTTPEDVLMRLGNAAKMAGDTDKAMQAFARVLYEFPFSDLATLAHAELERLPIGPITAGSNRYKLELGRAERLFGAKRYAPARSVFETLRPVAQGDDRELVALRLAESDYFLKRARAARDAIKPYVEHASRQGEALYFYAIAERDLGDTGEYFQVVRRLADDFGAQSWAEEALNNLATYYIVTDDDDRADAAFREMYEKFPEGHYAERAAWKIGWRAYTHGRYDETVRYFESAAAHFPRSDYRPSWLYWSGRAHDALKQTELADARYTLATTDYLNTYYGRLAEQILSGRGGRAPERRLVGNVQAGTNPADGGPAPEWRLPPNAPVIRALLTLALYDQALDELHYAQRVWGDSPPIQATIGWIFHERGDLRAAINALKRAYPQYMAAGGEKLPTEILRVIFPMEYWTLIKRYSTAHDLDPYLIAALVLQESNFAADVRSSANAYGLMQLLPSTGRQYARMLHITSKFSLRLLTTAEPNLKMGTAYFADLVKHFGGVHYALATYNAGPSRVARWISERPGIERDEFIDDIPFPETQNYVKRILGTAEDYRRLYGPGSPALEAADAVPAVAHGATPPAKKTSAAPTARKKPSSGSRKKTLASASHRGKKTH